MESFNRKVRKGAQTFPLVAKQRGGTQGGEFMSFTESHRGLHRGHRENQRQLWARRNKRFEYSDFSELLNISFNIKIFLL